MTPEPPPAPCIHYPPQSKPGSGVSQPPPKSGYHVGREARGRCSGGVCRVLQRAAEAGCRLCCEGRRAGVRTERGARRRARQLLAARRGQRGGAVRGARVERQRAGRLVQVALRVGHGGRGARGPRHAEQRAARAAPSIHARPGRTRATGRGRLCWALSWEARGTADLRDCGGGGVGGGSAEPVGAAARQAGGRGLGESAVGSEELRKERSSFRGTLERGAVRHALICIFWCPPLPCSARCLGLAEAGGGAESGWVESAGGMAEEWQCAGKREGRAGFCRAAASRSSRPSPQPAAVKPSLAKLGVALTPSHWHVLLATSAHPAAADSSLGPATFLTPRAPFNHHRLSRSLVLVCKGLTQSDRVRSTWGTYGSDTPHHLEETGPGFHPASSAEASGSSRVVWRHLQSLTSTALCPPSLKTEAARLASCLVACSWRLWCQASTRNRSVFGLELLPGGP